MIPDSSRDPHPTDQAADARLLILTVVLIGVFFAFGATAQSMLVHGVPAPRLGGHALGPVAEATLRASINLLTVGIIALGAAWMRIIDRPLWIAAACALLVSVVAATVRGALQLTFDVHPVEKPLDTLHDAITLVPVSLAVLGTGVAIVALSRRARSADRERHAAAIRAAEALDELQQEEIRVRREVADTLHGTLQNRFVMLAASLAESGAQLDSGVDAAESRVVAERVRAVRAELEELRERELRALSAALYPEALDLGLVPAARALMARIPPSIPVHVSVNEVPVPDPLDRTSRLLLVRAIEEGVSNALRHGEASELALRLEGSDGRILAEVRHLGAAPVDNPELSGLARLGGRISDRGGELILQSKPDGAALRAWLPAGTGAPA
ncbi:sensor histidine kinase [Leucobacter sp. VD1]|uniref:sensor histidine kinase n=1 Tax=Leucobacter sp. VD1 TaxID=3080381 RepID=UPI00301615DC